LNDHPLPNHRTEGLFFENLPFRTHTSSGKYDNFFHLIMVN
jgi:hypothetical protein